MNEDRFTIIPKASIRPNKIVFYKQFLRKETTIAPQKPLHNSAVLPIFPLQMDLFAPPKREKFSTTLDKSNQGPGITKQVTICNKHNFELSKKASGRIKEKISWLYELARNKTIITSNGKVLGSFKMNFITLTLPSLQAHTTAELTSVCLNQFLTECKAKFGLANYVWRLEFQTNGNAHYHIATDTFIDYTACKLIWNRCLGKLGYIQRYQEKFLGITFHKYCELYSEKGKIPFNVLRERFGRGCATRWDSPNTVDVRAIGNAKNIAFYISKYITKKSDEKLNPIVAKREPSETNLRLWFCSKSLSALSAIEIFLEEYDGLVDCCLSGITTAKRYIFDYCNVWYFNAREQANDVKKNLWFLYRRYSKLSNYVPA